MSCVHCQRPLTGPCSDCGVCQSCGESHCGQCRPLCINCDRPLNDRGLCPDCNANAIGREALRERFGPSLGGGAEWSVDAWQIGPCVYLTDDEIDSWELVARVDDDDTADLMPQGCAIQSIARWRYEDTPRMLRDVDALARAYRLIGAPRK